MKLRQLLKELLLLTKLHPGALDMTVVTEAGDYGLYQPIDGTVEIGAISGNDFMPEDGIEEMGIDDMPLNAILIT